MLLQHSASRRTGLRAVQAVPQGIQQCNDPPTLAVQAQMLRCIPRDQLLNGGSLCAGCPVTADTNNYALFYYAKAALVQYIKQTPVREMVGGGGAGWGGGPRAGPRVGQVRG